MTDATAIPRPPADQVHGRPEPRHADRRRDLARRDDDPLRRRMRRRVVEEIQAGSADEAAGLRRRADDDVAAVREWSKAEIARIREETEARIAARKTALDGEMDATPRSSRRASSGSTRPSPSSKPRWPSSSSA